MRIFYSYNDLSIHCICIYITDQIAIGMSLQVIRATVEDVRERLEMLKRKRDIKKEFGMMTYNTC